MSIRTIQPYKILPHTRPLFVSGEELICSRGARLFKTSTNAPGQTMEFLGEVPLSGKRKLCKYSSLARRVLRNDIYRLRVMDGGNMVFSFPGGMFVLRPEEKTAVATHSVRHGSRPVSLASNGRVVAFGEYFNHSHDEVHIYASYDGGESWKVAHVFPQGEIRHVHGMCWDEFEKCFWICTGDRGKQVQLLRADENFSDVRIVRQGSQADRYYTMIPTADALIAANDSPDDINYVRSIARDGSVAKNICEIDNSSFYSAQLGGYYFCSTNSERPESKSDAKPGGGKFAGLKAITNKVLRNFSQRKDGPGNDFSATHLWMLDPASGKAKDVLSLPVDMLFRLSGLPGMHPVLFQFTRIFFAEGNNQSNTLFCQAIGTKRWGDAMLCFKLSDLKEAFDA